MPSICYGKANNLLILELELFLNSKLASTSLLWNNIFRRFMPVFIRNHLNLDYQKPKNFEKMRYISIEKQETGTCTIESCV